MIDLLHQRRSVPSRLLSDPGPDAEQIQTILSSAVRVPDHGRLAPWRFIRIRGDARQALGEALATRRREIEPNAASAVIEKDAERFNHTPVIIAVIGCLVPGHKIPEQEQLLSGGAVCFAMLQAAHCLGFGAQWLTGWAAYDPIITGLLGLTDHERVLGFIHIGTARQPAPDRDRPDPLERLVDWSPK
ncbi:MAG: nitroreductase [Xanthomonadaceae bacterium]|nr:nitroreductase [Xanthomonadaceae bacterium]